MSNCVLAGALLGGFGLTSFLAARANRQGPSLFKASLRPEQLAKYEEIVAARHRLTHQGFLLGAIFALGYLIYTRRADASEVLGVKGGWMPHLCTAIAIALTTTYFYYILSPKSDYMIRHLDHLEGGSPQVDAFLQVNRAYQLRWTGGLLLGGAAAYFLGQAF